MSLFHAVARATAGSASVCVMSKSRGWCSTRFSVGLDAEPFAPTECPASCVLTFYFAAVCEIRLPSIPIDFQFTERTPGTAPFSAS